MTRKNITAPVITGFALFTLFFIALGALSVHTAIRLANITSTLENHCFRVSNAALSCKWAVSELICQQDRMFGDPRDANTGNPGEIERLKNLFSGYLQVVEDNVLEADGKKKAEDTRRIFSEWMAVMENLTTMSHESGRKPSIARMKSDGEIKAVALEKNIQELMYGAQSSTENLIGLGTLLKQRLIAFFSLALAFSLVLALTVTMLSHRWARTWTKTFFESEARFLGAFEHANSGVALVSMSGHLMKVNEKLSEIMEYSVDELERSTVDRITHPEDLHISRQYMNDAVSNRNDRAVFEKRYITRNGRTVYGEVAISLIRSSSDEPLYFVSHVKDVTESRKAMEALKKSENRYTLSHRIGGIGTFEWNIKKKKVYWAEETRAIFAVDSSGLGGDYEGVRERIHPEDYDSFLAAVSESIREKKEFRAEMRIVLPDNSIRHVRALGDVSRDDEGQPDTMTGVVMDITKIKTDEEKHRDLERQLMRSQKMEAIGRLAGGVAHDFNNLLSIILGYTELMKDELQEDHPHYPAVSEIMDASLRARTLTRQLLAFGRKQSLEIGVFDVNTVIRNFEKLLLKMISEDIELNLQLWEHPAMINADSSQLEQVLMNLVVNARDAMPNGGRLCIETTLFEIDEDSAKSRQGVEAGPYVLIAVSDTGMGIAKEDLDRIYEPFFTTKEQDKGSGMGLATVYGIVRQHGGHIWVYSEAGYGTTFKIYLPEVRGTPETRAVHQISKPIEMKKPATILVVEDDESLCVLSVRILEKSGYRVLYSHKPWEAVEKALEFKNTIDLLITDVIMPDMKGPDVYEKIRAIHPGVKVLYMSGYTESMITRHGVFDKEVGFIQKPFSKQMLLEHTAKALAVF